LTLSIIDSEGLGAVSLRAVARRLGVSEAAPYHHFANKSELLAVLAARAYGGLHRRMLDAIESAGKDPFSRLAAAGRSYVEYALESRGRFRLMFGEHMTELAEIPEVYAAAHPPRLLLEELVSDCVGVDSADRTVVEQSAWALTHGLAWLIVEDKIRFENGPADVEKLIDGALALLLSGIRSDHTLRRD
jgi:AcrR family transcriptional regulator